MLTYVIGVMDSSMRLIIAMSLGELLILRQELVDVADGN
jgi:hypothetical protein